MGFNNFKVFIMAIFPLVLGVLAILFLLIFNPYPLKFKEQILLESQKYSIAPEIVASVINTESGFDPNANSKSGALGLMQLMPATAKWVCQELGVPYSTNLLFSGEDNIKLGTYYLNYLLRKFQHLDTALAAYNAGEGNVMLWLLNQDYSVGGKQISSTPFKETNAYIAKVKAGIGVYSKKFAIK